MKVKELIYQLQKLDQELEVYGYCDHGQVPEKAQSPSIIYVKDPSLYAQYEEYVSSEEEAVEWGYTKKQFCCKEE